MRRLLLRVISLPVAGDGFPSHRSSVTRVKRPDYKEARVRAEFTATPATSTRSGVLAVALTPSWKSPGLGRAQRARARGARGYARQPG